MALALQQPQRDQIVEGRHMGRVAQVAEDPPLTVVLGNVSKPAHHRDCSSKYCTRDLQYIFLVKVMILEHA